MGSEERRKALAEEALKLVRFRLQKKLPVLGAAFSVTRSEWTEKASGTDAEMLYWNADEVLTLFWAGMEKLERRYLHLILHGMYLHRFRKHDCPERVWWLACDLMTEYRIDRMHVPGFDWPIPAERSRWYRKIREDGAAFDERALAGWLQGQEACVLTELEQLFLRDSHEWWRDDVVSLEAAGAGKQERAEKTRRASEVVHRWRTVFEQVEMRQEENRRQA